MNAYIVAGSRSAVGKAPKGKLRFTRPDDLAVNVLKHLMLQLPEIDKNIIDDVIVGNAFPEAEQGYNMGRIIYLLGLDTIKVPGMTVNRYCSSGLETISIASAKIHSGIADVIIAGGSECMSPMPFGGWRMVPNVNIAKKNPDWYWGMGLTAEAVAKEYNVTREEQDAFAFNSHQKALNAIKEGKFKGQIAPLRINEKYIGADEKINERESIFDTDEGPRADTSKEKLAKLRAVFSKGGTVTAGNSSQTSDGAAFLMVVSEEALKKYNLKPIARLASYAVCGVEPRLMGIGPVAAIPKACEKAGLKIKDIEQFELNEAFASQSVAVVKELGLDPDTVNVNGGAIALGHPLGCTGAKLSVQLLNEMRVRNQKYGMVTMCVGTGQGAAGIFELLN
ncbi:MAG TPA: acetyl-CoA C-acyltransferase [Bacteroidetes bacterium]|nr:acetyl-CoA C-acyltransferase [Bacteroidota bacterium]